MTLNDQMRKCYKEMLYIDDLNDNKYIIMSDYSTYSELIDEYSKSEPCSDIVKLCCDEFKRFIYNLTEELLEEFATKKYNSSLKYVMGMNEADEMKNGLIDFLKQEQIPDDFSIFVLDAFEKKLIQFNKRFSFSDADLIRLIETASGKNIEFFEGNIRRLDSRNRRMYLHETSRGSYHLKSNGMDLHTYTNKNKSINNSYEVPENDFDMNAIPVSDGDVNPDELMKKVIETIIDNIELCYEVYKKNYSGQIQATLSNKSLDGNRSLIFNVREETLPHLLGLPRFDSLTFQSQNQISNDNSYGYSALATLKLILENRDRIISDSGLYELSGRKYTILPWEKIALRTIAFMRGDYFKTCFCIAVTPNGLVNGENYATLTALDFSKYNIKDNKTSGEILRNLLHGRYKSDLIVRGLKSENGVLVSNTLLIGKKENIRPTNINAFLSTLEYFRERLAVPASGGTAYETDQSGNQINQSNNGFGGGTISGGDNSFNDSSTGSNSMSPIVSSTTPNTGAFLSYLKNNQVPIELVSYIQNEHYLKVFQIEEQLVTSLGISRNLGVVPKVSSDIISAMEKLHEDNLVSLEEVEAFKEKAKNNNFYVVSEGTDYNLIIDKNKDKNENNEINEEKYNDLILNENEYNDLQLEYEECLLKLRQIGEKFDDITNLKERKKLIEEARKLVEIKEELEEKIKTQGVKKKK